MTVTNIDEARGLYINEDLHQGSRLLLSKGSLITPEIVNALKNRSIKKLDTTIFTCDNNKGLGLLEADRSILDTNFDDHYSLERRRSVKQELLRDSKNGNKKSTALIEGIKKHYTSFCTPTTHEIESFREVMINLSGGKYIDFDLFQQKLTNQLENLFVKNLSKNHPSFPDPLVEIEALKQLHGDYTFLHSLGVAYESGFLAMQVNANFMAEGLPAPYVVENVILAGALHDCGKLHPSLDKLIFNKDAYSEEEKRLIKSHPLKGYEMLREYSNSGDIPLAALQHHETFLGSGYPDGNFGSQTDPVAALVAVVDKFDALSNDRPYRKKVNPENIPNVLVKESYGSVKAFKEKLSTMGLDITGDNLRADPFYTPIITLLRSKGYSQK